MSKAKLWMASLAMGVSLCILPTNSYADTNYTVQSGDTLWKIAENYNTTVESVRALNNLYTDLLYPGQVLLVSKEDIEPAQQVLANPLPDVSRSGTREEIILDYAKTFIGTPYRGGGSSPKGFDCSGYTSYVFKNFDINLPRTADGQYNYGQAVSAADAKPGDLVAFKSGGHISHVGIYMGGGKFIHSSSSKGIIISEVYDSYWGPRVLGFSRVIG